MHVGAVMMFAAILGLVVKINFYTLFLYIILEAAFIPFFTVPMSSASFNIINRNHEEGLRVEYVINREIVLNAGRVFSTLVFIVLMLIFEAGRNLNYFVLFLGRDRKSVV